MTESSKFDAMALHAFEKESRLSKLLRRSRRLARRLTGRDVLPPKRRILRRLARSNDDVRFVQIGAFDGKTGDPLHALVKRFRWRGVLVEPMPRSFERLAANYAGRDHVALENAAISTTDGEIDFWYLDPDRADELPGWHSQISSFSREHVAKHAVYFPDIEKYIKSRRVKCLTWRTLLRKHGIQRIDLLHVDAEGHDYEILQQVDLERDRPSVVLYEDVHLADADRAASRARLEAADYHCYEDGIDCVAVDRRQAYLAD